MPANEHTEPNRTTSFSALRWAGTPGSPRGHSHVLPVGALGRRVSLRREGVMVQVSVRGGRAVQLVQSLREEEEEA